MSREPAPHMELVTGGAQVEAAAHLALQLIGAAMVNADHADPTVAAELIERAHGVLATGLGLPREARTWTEEEEGDLLADEARIERLERVA